MHKMEALWVVVHQWEHIFFLLPEHLFLIHPVDKKTRTNWCLFHDIRAFLQRLCLFFFHLTNYKFAIFQSHKFPQMDWLHVLHLCTVILSIVLTILRYLKCYEQLQFCISFCSSRIKHKNVAWTTSFVPC